MDAHLAAGFSKDEILSQLAKILESQSFKLSPNPSKLFAYIIQTAITNADPGPWLKQEHLRQRVFGGAHHQENSSIVRVTANKLRKMLTRYYGAAGRYDLVIIGLPPGSYVPTFTRLFVDLGT